MKTQLILTSVLVTGISGLVIIGDADANTLNSNSGSET